MIERESSSQRTKRIHQIAENLLLRLENLEKIKAYFILVGREWNEEKLLFEIANKYSSLEVQAFENGYGIYNERWNNGWHIVSDNPDHHQNTLDSDLEGQMLHKSNQEQ